jgi:ParB family transcriptional regulator, chromosome partitioning protein
VTTEVLKHSNSKPVAIHDIVVGERYRKDLGDLEPLKASITELGLLHPVVIDGERRLLVGGRRLEACKQLGMLTIPAVTAASLSDLRQRVMAEKDENVCREPFKPSEWTAIGKVIEGFQRPIAEASHAAGVKEGGRPPKNSGGTSPRVSKPRDESKRTSSVAAAACGVDRRTYEKAKAVTQAAADLPKKFGHLVEQMDRTGKVNKAYSELRKAEKKAEREKAKKKVEATTGIKANERCSVGDVWILGDHVLYCGDTSTDEFWNLIRDRVQGKAALAFADPPYGANVEGYDDSKFYWEHDYLADAAEVVVVTPGIVSIFELARRTAMPYRWSIAAWITNGMTRGAVGFGNWMYAAVFSAGSVFRQAQDFSKVTISNAEAADTDHPTRKPTEYVQWIVETFSKPKDWVIDPFLGSGQTLMVCEASGRRCIGGELDPKFCSEIVARWEAMTKAEALKA